MRIVRRAAAPGNGAVARVREGVDVFAHTFVKDARDLARSLEEVLVAALLIEVDAEQALTDGVERAVVRLGIDVPALGLLAVELVGVFNVLDERVPVERLVELILEEVDGLVHLVHAELLAGRVVIHERGRERMHGLFAVARERAVHGDVVHHVRVAGVVGREPAVADVGILALDGDAGLHERQRAHIARDAAADGLIDVVRAEVLVQDRHHERRVLLDVDAEVAGEAVDDVLGQRVVKGDRALGPLVLAEAAVGADLAPHRRDGVGHHAVDGRQVGAQHHAAVAFDPFVDHHGRGEVGAQPAVFPEGAHHAHRVAADEPGHLDPRLQPAGEGIGRVPHAAPFAVAVEVRALDVQVAEIVAVVVTPQEVAERAVFFFERAFAFPHS